MGQKRFVARPCVSFTFQEPTHLVDVEVVPEDRIVEVPDTLVAEAIRDGEYTLRRLCPFLYRAVLAGLQDSAPPTCFGPAPWLG